MDKWEISKKLMRCFPNSFVNYQGEFVAHREANSYFILDNCKDELEVKCKVIAWFSRDAYKTSPFGARKNKEFHKFMLDGINKFLGSDFTENDMDLIYTFLGNDVNRKLCVQFIESGFDMSVLQNKRSEDNV